MHVPVRCTRIFRFGSFEFDPDNGELRKHGLKLRLVGQPVAVLTLLLERKGELVRREELQQRLWSSDTFVEFDHGLNAAVMRLREVLGDSFDQPRYVETVPRRGYRFIAPLEVAEAETFTVPELSPKKSSRDEKRNLASSRTRWTIAWIFTFSVAIVPLALYIFISRPPLLRIVRTFPITHDGVLKAPNPRSPISFVSDGARIYFTEFPVNVGNLYEVSAAGGEVVRLPQPFSGIYLADISLDRTELLVTSQDESNNAGRALWILPQPTGPPRRVGSIFASDAAFSPDGQYIVYASYTELYKIKVDGSGQQRLVTGAQVLNLPRWSPDGRKIRYTLWDKALATSRIWEVRSDGTEAHPLLPNWPKPQYCGAWTTDGTTFAFLSEGDVWTINESFHLFGKRNPKPVRLTTGPLRFRRLLPVPGRLLVISQQIQTQIARYDATQRQFVPILSQTSAASPNFSRDGQWLAYATTPAWDLWLSRADGSQRRQLTFPPMRLSPHPRWSPDGKSIAFAAGKDGEYSHIFVASRDGDKVEQLTGGEHLIDSDPVWSPDGASLIFARQGEANATKTSESTLCRIELGSKQLSTISASKGFLHPDWSPGGRYLAAFSDSSKLMLFDFITSHWKAIADHPKDSYWSKNEEYLYYATSDATAGASIMRVEIRSGKSESVLSLKDIQTSGGWIQLSLAPDDSPMIVRNAGRHDIYGLELAED